MSPTRILILGASPFGGLPQREHALAQEFARRGFVVDFVEPCPSLASLLRDRLRPPFALTDARKQWSGIDTHRPPLVPTFFRSSWTPALDRALFRTWFHDRFAVMDWDRVLLLITLPLWWDGFVDRVRVPARWVWYDRADHPAVFARTEGALRRLRRAEEALVRAADLVLCSSMVLVEDAQNRGARATSLLANAMSDAWLDPMDLTDRHGIVYVGSTDPRWFDRELLYRIAEGEGPPIHVIGPVDASLLRDSARHPRIHLHGPLPPREAATRAGSCRVGLIPFRDTELTRAVHPLKLYEYAARGLTVVATRSRELESLPHPPVLGSAEELPALVRAAHEAWTFEGARRARDWAERHTWSLRVNTLLSGDPFQAEERILI